MGKLCPLSLHIGPRAVRKTEGTVFPNTDRPRLVNNIFIFFCNTQYLRKTRLSLGCNRGKKLKNF